MSVRNVLSPLAGRIESLPCTHAVGAEPPVPKPDILTAIKSVAPFVASIGPSFEALTLQKNPNQSIFQFLMGGEGSEYYRWQLRALKAAKKDQSGLAIGQRTRPLTVGDRGLLLGEEGAAAAAGSAGQSAPKNFSVSDIAGVYLSIPSQQASYK